MKFKCEPTLSGRLRLKKRFAWLPVRRRSGECAWLETYFTLDEYWVFGVDEMWVNKGIYFLGEKLPVLVDGKLKREAL